MASPGLSSKVLDSLFHRSGGFSCWRCHSSYRYVHHGRQSTSRMFQVLQTPPKNAKRDMGCKSQRLMLYNGLIQQSHPGVFHMMPLALRALEKLHKVVDQEMHRIGAQKIAMPSTASGELWKASDRWNSTGPELFKLKDRHGAEYCLAPTHEESVTSLVAAHSPVSQKVLPIKLYQITKKFRDEMAPKYGLLRGREFEMKDLYTFDSDEEKAMVTYHSVCDAYSSIFDRLKLKYVKVAGAVGNIGGTMSHEYHLPASVGEDTLYLCKKCGFGTNEEILGTEEASSFKCKEDGEHDFEKSPGIEVGHTFLLGKKYSKVFKATYTNDAGKEVITEMGCYGLGVTRVLAASIEVLSTESRIRWPKIIAPYQVCVIPQKEGYKSDVTDLLAEQMYDSLNSLPNLHSEVVLDDRIHLSVGKRLYEANRLGYPYVIVLGKKALEDSPLYEVIDVNQDKTTFMDKSSLLDHLKDAETLHTH